MILTPISYSNNSFNIKTVSSFYHFSLNTKWTIQEIKQILVQFKMKTLCLKKCNIKNTKAVQGPYPWEVSPCSWSLSQCTQASQLYAESSSTSVIWPVRIYNNIKIQRLLFIIMVYFLLSTKQLSYFLSGCRVFYYFSDGPKSCTMYFQLQKKSTHHPLWHYSALCLFRYLTLCIHKFNSK